MKLFELLIQKFIGGDKKNKRLIYNTIFSFILKAVSILLSLMLLPAYMSFFSNQEVLGLWFTALSVLSWILTFDLGIGNGLRNNLVEAFANNDKVKIKKYISSAYIMFGTTVLSISIIGYFLFNFINWNVFFNISTNIVPRYNLLEIVRVLFIGIMLQFFLRLIFSVMYAMQKPALPSLMMVISNFLLYIFLILSKKHDIVTNLKILAYANVILVNTPILIATIIMFSKKLRYSVPSFKSYDKFSAKKIIKLGGVFFIIQIMYMLITNTNEFLISWTTDPKNVVDFKIYNSLFSFVGTIFLIALTPVWSEITEAYFNKEYSWIKRLYNNLYKLGGLGVLGLIILCFIIQFIVDVWLKDNAIHVDYKYSIIFLITGSLFIWNAILSSVANGIGKLKISIIFMSIGAVINIPLAFLFTHITVSWIGVIIANIFSMLPFCIAQTIWLNNFFNIEINTKTSNKLT